MFSVFSLIFPLVGTLVCFFHQLVLGTSKPLDVYYGAIHHKSSIFLMIKSLHFYPKYSRKKIITNLRIGCFSSRYNHQQPGKNLNFKYLRKSFSKEAILKILETFLLISAYRKLFFVNVINLTKRSSCSAKQRSSRNKFSGIAKHETFKTD